MKPTCAPGAIRAAVFALLLLPEVAFGQQRLGEPVDSLLSLDSLLEEVRANNTSLRAARLEAAALATQVHQVSALPDPAVVVGYQPYALLTARGLQRSLWRVEQMLPYPGKLALRGKVAVLGAEGAGYEAKTLEADLVLQAKQTYYKLWRIQQQESRILAFKDRLQAFADNAAAQYAVGGGGQQEILRAQLEGSMLTQTLLDLAAQRRAAIATLARLSNRPALGTLPTNTRVEAPPFVRLDQAALLEIALAQRPEVGALDAAARRADATIALARKQFRPDFGLNLTYFDIAGDGALPTATGRDAIAIGVSVKVPLQRSRLRAKLEEARIRREQVKARQEALETLAQTQIADLVSRLREEAKQLSFYEEVLRPQAESSLQATLSAYATGGADFSDLLQAEQVLFSLGIGFDDLFASFLNTTATLERVLGITSLSDLDAP